MKINIQCENDGWIYGKFIEMFERYSKNIIIVNSKDKCDITHYLPYYISPVNPQKPCTAWMSHMESKNPLREKFISAAKAVNMSISHSKKYMKELRKYGVWNTIQVIPGVDLDIFKIRDIERVENKRLVVGYVGRQYTSSNRKNPELLNRISKLPFVDFRTTGGKMNEEDIPKFYADLDLVVSPATIEGGPMSIQEALAVGTPIVCFEKVGVADEFGNGVIRVPFGNSDEFIGRLKTIWATKSYLHYRKPGIMRMMRKQVEQHTWKNFVEKHDKIWEKICMPKSV